MQQHVQIKVQMAKLSIYLKSMSIIILYSIIFPFKCEFEQKIVYIDIILNYLFGRNLRCSIITQTMFSGMLIVL